MVYLDPTAVELLSPEMTAAVLNDGNAEFAAPVGFGDSEGGAPVVGTTVRLVEHVSGGIGEGRVFAMLDEAVVGSLSPHAIGEEIEISHGSSDGHGGDADHVGEQGHEAKRANTIHR